MKAILLGGNSKKSNEEWIEDLKESLSSNFEDIAAVHYDHWDSEDEANLEGEKEKVKGILDEIEGDYIIIAKSMGIVIATYLIKKGKKPKYCIFVGFPLNEEDEGSELESNFDGFDIPTMFIQNQDERFMNPEQLERKLSEFKVSNFEVISGRGKEHAYTVEEIVDTIKEMDKKY
jgi:hypothetical protein